MGSVDVIASTLELALVGVLACSARSSISGRRGVTTASVFQYGVTVLSITALVVTFALAGAFGDAHLEGRHPGETPTGAQGD